MKEKLDTLLQKDMSRKEFLMILGFGFASLIGLKSLISSLDEFIGSSSVPKKPGAYGSSNYGNK